MDIKRLIDQAQNGDIAAMLGLYHYALRNQDEPVLGLVLGFIQREMVRLKSDAMLLEETCKAYEKMAQAQAEERERARHRESRNQEKPLELEDCPGCSGTGEHWGDCIFNPLLRGENET